MTDLSTLDDDELLSLYQQAKGGAPAGMKAAPGEWGPGAYVLPNGKVQRRGPRGGIVDLGEIPGAATSEVAPDVKEFQANAAARATLMDQGQRDYAAARQQGYNPGSVKNLFARGVEGSNIGNWFADVVRDNPSERGRAAELQFVDGALRTTSGANAPEPEVVRANRAYFRQPGESEGVEGNKGQLRQRFRDQSVRIAGPAYIAPESGRKPGFSRNMPRPQVQAAMRFRGSKAPSGTDQNPYTPASEQEYAALKPGARYIHPDGTIRAKR